MARVSRRIHVRHGWAIILAFAVLVGGASCGKSPENERSAEIVPGEAVVKAMDAHVDELMAIPGVVGVAVGALDDGKPCIMVLVVKKTPKSEKLIPRAIEGFPVRIEVSGEIRPMRGDSAR